MRRTDGQVEHHDHHRTLRSGAIDATIYYRDPRIVRAHQRQLLRNESRPCRVRSRSSAEERHGRSAPLWGRALAAEAALLETAGTERAAPKVSF